MTAAVRAAVVGDPIAHSRSPELHLCAYRELGLPEAEYERLRLPAGALPGALSSGRFAGLAGLSVTMPHKQDAAAAADAPSERVRLLGAANTLVFREGGIEAENTDVGGIVRSLREAAGGRDLTGPALVLGGGSTAAAALMALAELGAREAVAALRTPAKAFAGETPLSAVATALGLPFRAVPLDDVAGLLSAPAGDRPAAVVSALPPRAADPWAESWGSASRAGDPVLLDVAYDPWPSALAAGWAGPVAHGLSMLLHQAVRQVELFTGLRPGPETVDAMAAVVGLERGPGAAASVRG